MSRLIQLSFSLLQKMYDPKRALFSHTTELEREKYTSDFSYPYSLRYTINVLAGLQRAQEHRHLQWDVEGELDRFLYLHGQHVTNAGDNTNIACLPRSENEWASQASFAG